MKIQFQTLRAKNAWSYKHLFFDLANKGLCIIQGNNLDAGGSNGSGKSALAILFYYGITGCTPDGLRTDHLLSDFDPKNLEVHVSFYVLGIDYVISRYRSHDLYSNSVFLREDGKDLTCKNTADTQKKIYDILGLSRENLLLLTLFSIDTLSFAKCTPSERRALFTELFPEINRYREELAPKFKSRRETMEKLVSGIEKDLIAKESAITTLEDGLRQNQEKMTELADEIVNLTKDIESSDENKMEDELIEQINSMMVSLKSKYPQKVLDKIHTLSPTVFKLTNQVKGIQSEIDLLNHENGMHQTSLSRSESALEHVQIGIKNLQKMLLEGECHYCGSSLDVDNPPDKYQKEMKDLVDKEHFWIGEKKKFQNSIDKVNIEIEKQVQEKERLQKNLNILQKASADGDRLADLKKQQAEVSGILYTLIARRDNMASSLREYENTVQEYKNSILFHKRELEELKARKRELEEKYSMYEYLTKISSIDIPTYLLNRYMVILEEKASNIVEKLFPSMKIIISDTSTTKKGIDKAELTLGIETQNGIIKDYKTLSRGERQAVDISLLFGLQELIADETGVLTNIIFLDEIMDISADELRTLGILEFLREISSLYDSMFLITHKSNLTEKADMFITVTKENGISSLTEERSYSR